MIRVAVVGTGYVGLVTGACLADFGNEVRCVDVDAAKIERLSAGRDPVLRAGARGAGRAQRARGPARRSTTDLSAATRWAEVIFITVGTPPQKDGSADLSAIFAAGETIAKAATGYKVVVQKTTAPVGTARKLVERAAKKAGKRGDRVRRRVEPRVPARGLGDRDLDAARPRRRSAPRRRAREKLLRELHEPLYLLETPIMVTTLETAELIKYAVERVPRDQDLVHQRDGEPVRGRSAPTSRRWRRRWGRTAASAPSSCTPGPATAARASRRTRSRSPASRRAAGVPFRLVEAVVEVNERQKTRMVEKIEARARQSLKGKRVAVLGLTFKPNTDDIREAPALDIMAGLLRARRVRSRAYDPVGMAHVGALPIGRAIAFADDAYAALDGADCAGARHRVERVPDARPEAHEEAPCGDRCCCDLRNIYDADEAKAAGLTYVGVGQGAAPRTKADPMKQDVPVKKTQIQDVVVKPLKVIADERGYLMEMLRDDDRSSRSFGQVYLSVAYPGVVKGWHYHKVQYRPLRDRERA